MIDAIPKPKPKKPEYTPNYYGWEHFSTRSNNVATVQTTGNPHYIDDTAETEYLLEEIRVQIETYTSIVGTSGYETQAARDCLLEIVNLAGELEALRIDEIDDEEDDDDNGSIWSDLDDPKNKDWNTYDPTIDLIFGE